MSPLLSLAYLYRNHGLRIMVDDKMCITYERKQFRFPKSKKKRIRKKWSKLNKNYRLEKVEIAIPLPNGTFVVSSRIYEKIKNIII